MSQYILLGPHLYCFSHALCEHQQVSNREVEFAWTAFHYACAKSRIKARDGKPSPSVHLPPGLNTYKLVLKEPAPTTPYCGHRLCLDTSLLLQDILFSSKFRKSHRCFPGYSAAHWRSSRALSDPRRVSLQELAPALAQPTRLIHSFLHLAAGARLQAEVPNHPNSPPNILSLHYRVTHAPGRPYPNGRSPGGLHLGTD